MTKRRRAVRLVAAAAVVTFAVTAVPVTAGAQQSSWEVVASGLNNPRHLTFAPNGDLFVVEAGFGGGDSCSEHPDLGVFCLGFSGAVRRVSDAWGGS
jgi:hypothetical protein